MQNGPATRARPLPYADFRAVREFASAATRDGRTVTEEAVYDGLVREYGMGRMSQSSNRRGRTLLRGFCNSGSLVIFVTLSEPPLPPSTCLQPRAIATVVRAK
ncbi:hypothetical protein [Streptomyces sp. CT34]|uniref:hypothetical protein n=1 Tax=Streptomyces sp. CT34 TaxID=1553907 RepID=UPI0005B7DF50|nr:hypothetical protein [Streptomyces sp. CT34]